MNFLFVVFVNKANKKGKQYMNYILCKKISKCLCMSFIKFIANHV